MENKPKVGVEPKGGQGQLAGNLLNVVLHFPKQGRDGNLVGSREPAPSQPAGGRGSVEKPETCLERYPGLARLFIGTLWFFSE